jgi:hypothetical protein
MQPLVNRPNWKAFTRIHDSSHAIEPLWRLDTLPIGPKFASYFQLAPRPKTLLVNSVALNAQEHIDS